MRTYSTCENVRKIWSCPAGYQPIPKCALCTALCLFHEHQRLTTPKAPTSTALNPLTLFATTFSFFSESERLLFTRELYARCLNKCGNSHLAASVKWHCATVIVAVAVTVIVAAPSAKSISNTTYFHCTYIKKKGCCKNLMFRPNFFQLKFVVRAEESWWHLKTLKQIAWSMLGREW